MALPRPRADGTTVVTGASSGIGRELARELAARGLGLTLVARREDRLVELADELRDRHGTAVEVVTADLADPASRVAIADTLAARGLEVDVLVNNAGFSTTGRVSDSDPERELLMVRTDVEAVVHLCSLFLGPMVGRGSGAVLNVASTAAFQPLPGQAGYGASKAFVLSYTQAIRAELTGRGVTVTALCPGPVETEFAEVAQASDDDAAVLPKIMWVAAPDVATAAVDGLERGRAVVIPGAANRATAVAAQLTPRSLLLPILARQRPSLQD